jgi:hypothetical protein
LGCAMKVERSVNGVWKEIQGAEARHLGGDQYGVTFPRSPSMPVAAGSYNSMRLRIEGTHESTQVVGAFVKRTLVSLKVLT